MQRTQSAGEVGGRGGVPDLLLVDGEDDHARFVIHHGRRRHRPGRTRTRSPTIRNRHQCQVLEEK